MKPLGMLTSRASINSLPNRDNIVAPHTPVNRKVTTIDIEWSETANTAGGIVSNITDLDKWLIMQMDNGLYDGNKRLFSEAVHEDFWSP